MIRWRLQPSRITTGLDVFINGSVVADHNLSKDYVSRLRQILWDAEFAKAYMNRHPEHSTDVYTFSTHRRFLYKISDLKLED